MLSSLSQNIACYLQQILVSWFHAHHPTSTEKPTSSQHTTWQTNGDDQMEKYKGDRNLNEGK